MKKCVLPCLQARIEFIMFPLKVKLSLLGGRHGLVESMPARQLLAVYFSMKNSEFTEAEQFQAK